MTPDDCEAVVPMGTRDALARTLLWLALLVSLAGFLGYYNAQGFVSPPPMAVLTAQLAALGGAVFLLNKRLFVDWRVSAPLLLLAAWSATTLLWADAPAIGLRRWLLVFVPGILLFALAARDPRPHQTFVWFIGFVTVITLASGVFSGLVMAFWDSTVAEHALRYFLIDVNGWSVGIAEGGRQYELGWYIPRFSGLTSNPNSISLFAAIGVIGLCALARPRGDARSAALLVIIALVVCMLLLSGSRAAFAMTLTGIFFVAALRTDRRRIARLAILLICGLTVVLYLLAWLRGAAPDPAHVEIFELRQRSDTWRIALQAIGDVWLSGIGFGLTQEAVYAPLGLDTTAHSVPLSMLLEAGVPGLALMLFVWFLPVYRGTGAAAPLTATEIAAVSLLAGLFVHQAVDSSVFRYHWAHFVFAYLLGVSAGLAGSRASA